MEEGMEWKKEGRNGMEGGMKKEWNSGWNGMEWINMGSGMDGRNHKAQLTNNQSNQGCWHNRQKRNTTTRNKARSEIPCPR